MAKVVKAGGGRTQCLCPADKSLVALTLSARRVTVTAGDVLLWLLPDGQLAGRWDVPAKNYRSRRYHGARRWSERAEMRNRRSTPTGAVRVVPDRLCGITCQSLGFGRYALGDACRARRSPKKRKQDEDSPYKQQPPRRGRENELCGLYGRDAPMCILLRLYLFDGLRVERRSGENRSSGIYRRQRRAIPGDVATVTTV